ncbi:MAG: NADH-quinone oxidoreductase subunit N, partial [Ignavibacteriales bacterium]|nr:NADH-quinone oxidoreductase subunit N [Ignavibacteriales bacterium]
MDFSYAELLEVSPILTLSATALLGLLVKAAVRKSERIVFVISLIGILLSAWCSIAISAHMTTAFSDMMLVGGYASFFQLLFLIIGFFTIVLAEPYIRKTNIYHAEFYILVLFAVIGMMLMGGAADLIVMFLGLELMSISFYVLAGFSRTNDRSNEAALKYFLLGAFATGFLLYGIALLYGAARSTNLIRIGMVFPIIATHPWAIAGLGLLLIGFGFKVAAVPFHMWVPDVYEGAPTPVAGLMSTGGKAAAFSAMILLFAIPISGGVTRLIQVIAVLAAASMVVGNIFGLAQTNLKRMLAYSSITHAGYMLVGLASGKPIGLQGILFYLVSYSFTNLGAFGVIAMLEQEGEKRLTYQDYAGLGRRKPVVAAFFSIFLFSLTGIPPFSGFIGKYYLFAGAVESHQTWLAILGVV